MIVHKIHRVSCAALLLLSSYILTQTGVAQPKAASYGYSLTLNGHALMVSAVSLNSQGVLAWVDGNPATKQSKPLPFRVYLRRAGAVVRCRMSDETQAVYSAQLHDILPVARPGDELVLELAATDAKPSVSRVINVINYDWLFPGDNC